MLKPAPRLQIAPDPPPPPPPPPLRAQVRGLSEATRREMGAKIRTYKDSLSTVATDLKRVKERFSRSSLMAGAAGSAGGRPLDFDKSA